MNPYKIVVYSLWLWDEEKLMTIELMTMTIYETSPEAAIKKAEKMTGLHCELED